MERKDAIIALEDDLQDIDWMVQKASLLLQDMENDFFIYTEMPASAAALVKLREGYDRARAKTELSQRLITEAHNSLGSMLME